MLTPLLRLFGHRVAHKAIARHTEGGVLDVRFGLALLRDRRVPLLSKFLALGLGVGLAAGLIALELPLQSILAFVLPIAGIALDAVLDGSEAILGSLVLAALVLPRVAPKAVVQQIRDERVLRQAIPVTATPRPKLPLGA